MISREDHARIVSAIRSAEERTTGEIVCVLARTRRGYGHLPALWAGALALLVPWALLALTQWSVQRILLAQLATFGAAVLVLSVPEIRTRLVPRAVQRANAHREALAQFHQLGISRTTHRCGVLVFVSLPERYARIIADEGIASRVQNTRWAEAIALLIAGMKRGDVADAMVVAIERCGAILAQEAPPTGERGELPDRLYIV